MDLISAKERATANACGIQVSSNYSAADSALQSVIAACQAGKKTEAEAYYKGAYTKQVEYAKASSKALSCGANDTTNLPTPTAQTYYNLCVKTAAVGDKLVPAAACVGPVKENDSNCGGSGLGYLTQHRTATACDDAGKKFLSSR